MDTIYKTWQEAYIAFIKQYGDSYKDAYNMSVEFEMHLRQNRHGVYFLKKEGVL